jgi:hypothetical protein
MVRNKKMEALTIAAAVATLISTLLQLIDALRKK